MLPHINPRRFTPRVGVPDQGNQPPGDEQTDDKEAENQFYPGIFDVLKVRHILLWKIKSDGLPAEVVDLIIDAAEYWPSSEVALQRRITIQKDVDQAVLSTSPLCFDEKVKWRFKFRFPPVLGYYLIRHIQTLDTASPQILPHRTIHPCRKIVFSILSHDQGGYPDGAPDSYHGSFTWFDAEVIHKAHEPSQRDGIHQRMNPIDMSPKHYAPNDPLLLPRDNALQRNRARRRSAKRHTVVWHHLDNTAADSPEAEDVDRDSGRGRDTLDGRQVREMELGDSIVVWARARFPGWKNYVDSLTVRVFWAI